MKSETLPSSTTDTAQSTVVPGRLVFHRDEPSRFGATPAARQLSVRTAGATLPTMAHRDNQRRSEPPLSVKPPGFLPSAVPAAAGS